MRIVAPVALALVLAGCTSSSQGPRPAELEPAGKAPVHRLWRENVDGGGAFQFSPVRVGEVLYAAARDGNVECLSVADGRTRWRASLDRLSGGVGADEHVVAVGTDQGEVVLLEAADGKVRWRAQVSSEVLAAPFVAGELVLVRTADSRIHALESSDGKRRWMYQRTPAPLTLRTPQGMAARDGLLFAGFSGGKLVALNLQDGALRWEATVAVPKGATELERVTDVIGDPALIDGGVCAAAFQGRVGCYDAQRGTQLWSKEMSSVTGVSIDDRYAFISDELGAVHALDRASGRSIWTQDKLLRRQLSLPLAVGDAVVVADFEGYVHWLSRETGAFIKRASTDGSAVRAAPIAIPGGFVVQTQDGGLYAFAP